MAMSQFARASHITEWSGYFGEISALAPERSPKATGKIRLTKIQLSPIAPD